MKTASPNGFTLVEMLVVIFIMGLLASVVVLTIPEDRGVLESDAQTFAARVAALRDNAILQSRPMAVDVTVGGYGFLERRSGEWVAMNEKPFVSTRWETGVSAALPEDQTLRIAFESTGLAPDAQNVVLRFGGRERMVTIAPMGDVALAGGAP